MNVPSVGNSPQRSNTPNPPASGVASAGGSPNSKEEKESDTGSERVIVRNNSVGRRMRRRSSLTDMPPSAGMVDDTEVDTKPPASVAALAASSSLSLSPNGKRQSVAKRFFRPYLGSSRQEPSPPSHGGGDMDEGPAKIKEHLKAASAASAALSAMPSFDDASAVGASSVGSGSRGSRGSGGGGGGGGGSVGRTGSSSAGSGSLSNRLMIHRRNSLDHVGFGGGGGGGGRVALNDEADVNDEFLDEVENGKGGGDAPRRWDPRVARRVAANDNHNDGHLRDRDLEEGCLRDERKDDRFNQSSHGRIESIEESSESQHDDDSRKRRRGKKKKKKSILKKPRKDGGPTLEEQLLRQLRQSPPSDSAPAPAPVPSEGQDDGGGMISGGLSLISSFLRTTGYQEGDAEAIAQAFANDTRTIEEGNEDEEDDDDESDQDDKKAKSDLSAAKRPPTRSDFIMTDEELALTMVQDEFNEIENEYHARQQQQYYDKSAYYNQRGRRQQQEQPPRSSDDQDALQHSQRSRRSHSSDSPEDQNSANEKRLRTANDDVSDVALYDNILQRNVTGGSNPETADDLFRAIRRKESIYARSGSSGRTSNRRQGEQGQDEEDQRTPSDEDRYSSGSHNSSGGGGDGSGRGVPPSDSSHTGLGDDVIRRLRAPRRVAGSQVHRATQPGAVSMVGRPVGPRGPIGRRSRGRSAGRFRGGVRTTAEDRWEQSFEGVATDIVVVSGDEQEEEEKAEETMEEENLPEVVDDTNNTAASACGSRGGGGIAAGGGILRDTSFRDELTTAEVESVDHRTNPDMPKAYAESMPSTTKLVCEDRRCHVCTLLSSVSVLGFVLVVLFAGGIVGNVDSGGAVNDDTGATGTGDGPFMPPVVSTVTPTMSPTRSTLAPTADVSALKSVLVQYTSQEKLEKVGTPQHSALLWLANDDATDVVAVEDNPLFSERYACVVFFFAATEALQGEDWRLQENWLNPTTSICEWHSGIICKNIGGNDRVQTLDVSKAGLAGHIPDEIGLLEQAEVILLNDNRFSGSVPSNLEAMINLLRLDLSMNSLSGSLPTTVGLLSALNQLDLSSNVLTGPIPEELFQTAQMRDFDISKNRLSGTISNLVENWKALSRFNARDNHLGGTIPVNFVKLEDMRFLHLDNNRLTGSLGGVSGLIPLREEITVSNNRLTGMMPGLPTSPMENPNVFDRLKTIDFSGNLFIGPLDGALAFLKLPALRYVDLSRNSFSGSFPDNLRDSELLVHLNVSLNSFSGTLPPMGSPTATKILDFHGNPLLEGGIPSYLMHASLDYFDVSDTMIGGTVPKDLSPFLRSFLASNADLSGTIPTELGLLKNTLNVLRLNSNDLTGPIPTELGELEALFHLSLGRNRLTGPLPTSLGELTNLRTLSVGANSITGNIPAEYVNMRDLEEMDLVENRIFGAVPDGMCALPDLARLTVDATVTCSCCEAML